jgi:hypothetical protein
MKTKCTIYAFVLTLTAINGAQAQSPPSSPVPVTADNFIRAQSDAYFGVSIKRGGLGKFIHNRELAPVDRQNAACRATSDQCALTLLRSPSGHNRKSHARCPFGPDLITMGTK